MTQMTATCPREPSLPFTCVAPDKGVGTSHILHMRNGIHVRIFFLSRGNPFLGPPLPWINIITVTNHLKHQRARSRVCCSFSDGLFAHISVVSGCLLLLAFPEYQFQRQSAAFIRQMRFLCEHQTIALYK